MNKTCGSCDKTNGLCYTSDPPKFLCEITGKFHAYGHECDVKEDNVDKQDKPRICEVLGVEVGERFNVSPTKSEYYINGCGEMICISDEFHPRCGGILETIINHPDRIIRGVCEWYSTDMTKVFRCEDDFCSDGERRSDNAAD